MRGQFWLFSAALAPLLLATACGANAPPASRASHQARSRLPRLSWHPRKGTTEIDCHEHSYDCDKVGLEKCESECADGELQDCVALGSWQPRNVAKGGNPARGLSLLRMACDEGFGLGCTELAADAGVTPHDRAKILATLAPVCARGELCGCALQGEALTYEPTGGARGIELLSDSCARGAIDACDGIALLRDICERDHSKAGYCERIRADLRPRWTIPRWPAAELPASLEGCYQLSTPVDPPDGDRCVTEAAAKEHGWSTERGQVCPTDGSFDPGTLYCFFGGQYFVKPPQGPWDAHPARWAAPQERLSFQRHFEVGNDGDGEYLVADQGYLAELRREGGELFAAGDGAFARLDRLAEPAQAAERAAVAALPSLDQTCDKAYRCSEALRSWSGHRPSSGLRACLESLEADRARVETPLGTEAAKDACR